MQILKIITHVDHILSPNQPDAGVKPCSLLYRITGVALLILISGITLGLGAVYLTYKGFKKIKIENNKKLEPIRIREESPKREKRSEEAVVESAGRHSPDRIAPSTAKVSLEAEPSPVKVEVTAGQVDDQFKSTHVFIASAPFEGKHMGDTDYAEKLVDLLKKEKIKASYITGETEYLGSALYNPKNIQTDAYRMIIDDDTRKQAVANVFNYILSHEGSKIFHLQLRTPETGCMFLPEDLKNLKKKGVKVIVTCHEWQLNNDRVHFQRQAMSYFQQSDKVVFLNQKDASHALNFAKTQLPEKEFPAKYSVTAVPVTVSIDHPPSVDEVVKRDSNILIFGLMRANKGFEEAVDLAKLISKKGLKECKVIIAGKPMSFSYFISLAKPVLALQPLDIETLTSAWNKDPVDLTEFRKAVDLIQKENRPHALPAEFHLNLNEMEMQALVSKCKYAYKPDNKGFANNASSVINLLANGCVTFSKWGIVTSDEFLKGGKYEKALSLTKDKKSMYEFSPHPEDVLAEIVKRENDPLQQLNRETVTAALKATHDQTEGIFSDQVIAKEAMDAYQEMI